jgi:hypothetical protein
MRATVCERFDVDVTKLQIRNVVEEVGATVRPA